MRSKDLTLSASLIGLYVAIIVIGATTPLKITALMLSALFGLFWNYLQLKTNLTIQAVRFLYNLCTAVKSLPLLTAIMKGESLVGLAFLDLMNATGGTTYDLGVALLTATAKARPTIQVWIMYGIYALIMCFGLSYSFYRYFKRIGIFRRLPSF